MDPPAKVTNNFAEIKSTVFKRYEEKSLFPIIASDIVERFYVMLDIIFVIARLIPGCAKKSSICLPLGP